MRRKVAVAMSGGVDSSVAAALLKEEKYEVTGLTMRLWGNAGDDMDAADSAVSSASKTCRILGIPHRVIDIREQFKKKVIDYFLSEYLRGLTPNPCVVCNEKIKFGLLMDMMALDGAERLATGHYADIAFDAGTGRHNLLCAADRKKDQSYFLYRLNQRQLGLTLFPLGGMIKAEVIGKARAMGLPAAEREESQEICFVPGDDYRALIESERPGAVQGGDFIDMDGRVIGRHKGVAFYTIGQRRGLGYSSQLGRRYVIARDPFNNTVSLGGEKDLLRKGCTVGSVNFISIDSLEAPMRAEVKLRYRFSPVKATLIPETGAVKILFDNPEPGVSPGQSEVFYDGAKVIGGGIITDSE